MYCAQCGTKLPDNASFCTNCGWETPSRKEEIKKANKNKNVEILCLVIGVVVAAYFLIQVLLIT